MERNPSIEAAYARARDAYAALGVDPEHAMARLDQVAISMHCWQGDDVRGFENPEGPLTGGIAATGNYPGRARNADELRADADLAMAQIPGPQRFNLHASYLEAARPVERTDIGPEHFQRWVDWARDRRIGLDFNPTLFSHPKSDDGATLSHRDPAIRRYWIDHCRASRRVGAHFGKSLGTPSVTNLWIPDGSKDLPYDRFGPRRRLVESLDEILATPLPREHHRDAVEGKLFGLGAEAYTVGSHELYLAYATRNGLMVCLDSGHYHPTESVADKISSVIGFVDGLLLHISRPVRWDSDHVVVLDDETQAIAHELVRGDALDRVAIALDFFDASINRVAAWVIGTRNVRRALLRALLEPGARLAELEARGDFTARLALLEEQKALPWGAVWDHYCERSGAPVGMAWLDAVRAYERGVLRQRDAA
ncbi:MAG TPA: L-rhamnose isomerase [Kofleriaceae bacterium]|jgi:L-rhamnose isomerase|nr:L-rhamnose isomerase [Kofleriaceae bacterium]